MDRYDKNAKSVREMCKILGYRLVGYDPDWSITAVDEKIPNNVLAIITNQMLGRCDQISDELMGRIALIMGFDWEFHMGDVELKKLISQCNESVEETRIQNELRLKLFKKAGNKINEKDIQKRIEEIKKDGEEYLKETKAENGQKTIYFENMIQLRERLRGFINSQRKKKDIKHKPDKKVSVEEFRKEIEKRTKK